MNCECPPAVEKTWYTIQPYTFTADSEVIFPWRQNKAVAFWKRSNMSSNAFRINMFRMDLTHFCWKPGNPMTHLFLSQQAPPSPKHISKTNFLQQQITMFVPFFNKRNTILATWHIGHTKPNWTFFINRHHANKSTFNCNMWCARLGFLPSRLGLDPLPCCVGRYPSPSRSPPPSPPSPPFSTL